MKAIWKDVVLAESDNTIVVEDNHYFPPDSVNREYLKEGATHTTCPWKGVASYCHVEVEGKTAENAAWFYPEVKPKAESIRGRVAFWNGVKVVEFDLGSEVFDSAFAASKYLPIEGFAELRQGHVVLQDHGDEVWFRNIRIREIEP